MWGAPPAQGAQGAVGAGQDDGGLIWVPLGDGLAHPSQQAGQQARPAAVPETLPFAPPLGLQAAGAPAAALNGLQQLDGALLQPLPSLPMPGADASAGGTGQPAGASSAATTEAVDKQAVAREKNRLAQRRFREKERQKVAEAEAQADAMRRQLSQLRLENERLQMEQTLLEKLLVVRDAILSVVVQLDTLPPSQQQQGQAAQQGANGSSILGATARPSVTALLEDPAALQAASQQLAAALGELPSLEQMEQMVAQMGGDSTPEGGASSGSSGGSGSSAAGSQAGAGVAPAVLQAEAAVAPPLSAAVGAAAASGVVVERSRLQEAVPLPSAAAEREAEALDHVECLYEYWRQWRLRLGEVFDEAKACNFSDLIQLEVLEVHMREPLEVIWAACHVRPKVFNLFLARCLPPPHVDLSAEWTRIAEESLPLISDGEIAFFRRAIQRYTKQAALAAVGVRPWVQRLQLLVAAQRSGEVNLSRLAEQHTQVREVATRLQRACTEQYLACLAFLAEVGSHSRTPVRCMWILAGGPYAPDHLAILSEIVRLHQQRQRRQLAAPAQPPCMAGQPDAQPMQQGGANPPHPI